MQSKFMILLQLQIIHVQSSHSGSFHTGPSLCRHQHTGTGSFDMDARASTIIKMQPETGMMTYSSKVELEIAECTDVELKKLLIRAIIQLRDMEILLMGKEMEDRVHWEENRIDLGQAVNWTAVRLGDVVNVSALYHSGLSRKTFQPMYIRQASLDLHAFLTSNTEYVRIVMGCPGIGKSVQVFSHAMWVGQTMNKRVLYIHALLRNGFAIIFKDDSSSPTARVSHIEEFVAEPIALKSLLLAALKEGRVDLIVLDGDLAWLIEAVYSAIILHPQVAFITCTSYQAIGKESQEAFCSSAGRVEHCMDSWKEYEYEDAHKAGALTLQSGLSVKEMFYYAGGSVRLLLLPRKTVKTMLLNKIRYCPDVSKLIGENGVGDASAGVINSLVAIYDDKSIVLSQFVMRRINHMLSYDFIYRAREFLPNNPAWQGWLTEAEVFHLVMKHRELLAFRNDPNDPSSTETWHSASLPVAPFITPFNNVSDAVLTIMKVGWFQPSKWNEAGFDALFRVSEHKLRVVQITDSPKRSLNLAVMIPLVKAMDIHVVEVIHICRAHVFKAFKVTRAKDQTPRIALEVAMQEVYDSKMSKSRLQERLRHLNRLPDVQLSFRTVCHELDATSAVGRREKLVACMSWRHTSS